MHGIENAFSTEGRAMVSRICVKTRNRECARMVKKTSRSLILAGVILALFSGVSAAELAAPSWMPGFPILAGPQLMLMWSPVQGAVKYRVLINDQVVAETAVFQHFMPAPEKAGEYKVKVVAVDAAGKTGTPSREWATKVFKLAPPANIYERSTEKTVGLRWDPVPNAAIYNVYKRVGKEAEYKLLASVQETSYTDTTVVKDEAMRYAVSSKDASGKESERSKDLVVTVRTQVVVKAAAYRNLIPITSKTLMEIRGGATPEGAKVVIANPGGITETGDKIFVTDVTKGRVLVFDRGTGNFERAIGRLTAEARTSDKPGEFDRPIGITVDRAGNLLVTEIFKGKIVRLTPAGDFQAWWDLPPFYNEKRKANELANPVDIKQLSTGEYVVLENAWGRLLLLDASGKFNREIKLTDEKGVATTLASPGSMTVDAKDRIYIADSMNGRVLVVNPNGKVVRAIGQPGDIVGEFGGLIGVTLMEDMGWVVAVDAKYGNIQLFSMENGEYLYSVASEDKKVALPLSIPQRVFRLSDGSLAVSEGLVDAAGGGVKIVSIDKPAKK